MAYSIPSTSLPFAFPSVEFLSPPGYLLVQPVHSISHSSKQVQHQSDPNMALHLEEISIDSHNNGLKLKPAQKPYNCGGCKEPGFDSQTCYECLECDFHLHQECVPPPDTFYLGLIRCHLTFQPDPRGNTIACEACGKHVWGWFYQGFWRGKQRYLHRCCAKLPFKTPDNNNDDMLLDLEEKTSLVCLICGNQGNSKDFKSWVYVPRSRTAKYCYHVACVKGKVETWRATEEGGSVQPSSYGAGTSSAGAVAAAGRQREGIIIKQGSGWGGKVEIILEMAVEILNIVVSLFLGLPAFPFSLVIKWLNGTK